MQNALTNRENPDQTTQADLSFFCRKITVGPFSYGAYQMSSVMWVGVFVIIQAVKIQTTQYVKGIFYMLKHSTAESSDSVSQQGGPEQPAQMCSMIRAFTVHRYP